MIQIKRIYDPAGHNDGYRVLIDRLWPRGIKKDQANIDLWLKEVAPTPELRKWFHEDPIERWREFDSKYRAALVKNEAVTALTELVEKHQKVTLVYGAKDQEHNHALILRLYLEEKMHFHPTKKAAPFK
ncbi:DUF488 domain-containing protein [Pedobacter immunditicola]|uniref:DUF488 domain-containing protein n=1 Tax=Pedobacter immunditicola TaxID=3133440 RepID=UPI0030AC48B0